MYDDAKRFWNAWGFPFSCKVSLYASLVRRYDSTTVSWRMTKDVVESFDQA